MKNMKIKKTIYVIMSIFLFFMFSMLVHAWIEMWYIQNALDSGGVLRIYGPSEFLPPFISFPLSFIFSALGYVVGQKWWRIVYIEKRHWRFKK